MPVAYGPPQDCIAQIYCNIPVTTEVPVTVPATSAVTIPVTVPVADVCPVTIPRAKAAVPLMKSRLVIVFSITSLQIRLRRNFRC